MNRATRTLAIAASALLLAQGAFALDFGFDLSNLAGLNNGEEFDWYTDHKETGWVTVPFNEDGTASLAIEGSLYAAKPVGTDGYTWFADLDLLRVRFVPYSSAGARLGMSVGRLPESDVTGFILGQTVDGVEANGVFSFGNMDFFAGYTGLLNTRKGGSIMTNDDQLDNSDHSDDVYGLGSQHAIGKVTLQVPEAFGSVDVIVEALGEYDMRRFLDSGYTSTADLVFGTLAFSAPLGEMAFGTLSGTWQSGVKEENDALGSSNSILATARVDMFPTAKNQVFGQVIYTPLENDFFDVFTPISYQSLGTLYSRNFSNLLRASAGWNFNPYDWVNLDVGGKVFMVGATNDAYPDFYNGSEFNAGATVKTTSDLKFRLDSYFWVPADGTMELQASLKAIFSF